MVQRLSPEPTLLFEHFYALADKVLAAWDEEASVGEDTNPRLITLAVQDLQEAIGSLHGQYEVNPPEEEVTRCTDYAVQLFSEMSHLAAKAELDEEAIEIENICFPFALWGVRHGAELITIEPVVNAIARLANSRQQPGFLEELYREVSEVMRATSIQLTQEVTLLNLANPWRILLLNRAIIATRSHQVALMNDAFSAIVEYLPDEASEFFREGMEQMDQSNYPEHVREQIATWYQRYSSKPTLH
ncbi:hypothetical protein [Solemya velum gill symbiont]|uniref:Uncharacterized protein n=1 Tax=Solemya velum gill symbiont TaxID=2340 RepID=A0A0B0HBT0_SOVGS|nr:hypothetical protein [Solemya velum gill symbiont]KHF24861.1 hypothetical protein JV46_08440 [Solemya velum gill symbiont]OOY35041.1 hypothetical protein BOV88_06895 [Solemya velum gill symbiont]OOY37743.1 hypothetical protein BOV89_05805 [Solemya velum gill symbiont]OOY40595.1 hypothetical protein BOV90_03410 [Solemya velum gill symbiont]OOY41510.1 hypothetical protein BOV91_11100 [Solemya velum gill symbiont]